MTTTAICLSLLWLLLTAVVRISLQLRRTGDSGLRLQAGTRGSAEWYAFWLSALSIVGRRRGPHARRPRRRRRHPGPRPPGHERGRGGPGLDRRRRRPVGAARHGRLVADRRRPRRAHRPGDRRGSSPSCGTRSSRRWWVTAVGFVLMIPNVVSIVAAVALTVAVELQVRAVEEPYLRRVHGARYVDYARPGRPLRPRCRPDRIRHSLRTDGRPGDVRRTGDALHELALLRGPADDAQPRGRRGPPPGDVPAGLPRVRGLRGRAPTSRPGSTASSRTPTSTSTGPRSAASTRPSSTRPRTSTCTGVSAASKPSSPAAAPRTSSWTGSPTAR